MMTWSIFSIPCGSPGVEVLPLGLPCGLAVLEASTPPWACVHATPTTNSSAIMAAYRVALGGDGLIVGQESTWGPPVSPDLVRERHPCVYALGLRPLVRARPK
jgi:hypothetical protein